MYGLKQAAVLAYEHLIENLAPHGYRPIPRTTGLWKHYTRPITFCLCVDDFGVKYYIYFSDRDPSITTKLIFKVSVYELISTLDCLRKLVVVYVIRFLAELIIENQVTAAKIQKYLNLIPECGFCQSIFLCHIAHNFSHVLLSLPVSGKI